MIRFLFSRLANLLITLIGVTIISFLLIKAIPNNPIALQAGVHALSAEKEAELIAQHGLDQPLITQYFHYIKRLSQGNFGQSFASGDAVIEDFLTFFPATVELSFFAMLFAISIGLPLGIIAALKRGKPTDYLVMTTSLTGYSIPIYWWGPMLIFFFSVHLHLLPVDGRLDAVFWIEPITGFMLIDTILLEEYEAFWSALQHLILPAFVLGTIPMAVIARMTRSSLLEVLSEDYIRTAYAKGLSKSRIILKHALRNAMIPVITVIGLQVSTLMVGAILTEHIFSWPGIGSWMVTAIQKLDYPIIQSGMLLIAIVIISVNFLVDILYGIINPRVR